MMKNYFFVFLLLGICAVRAQAPINAVVHTVDASGCHICLKIVGACSFVSNECGDRCVIDARIFKVDCIHHNPINTDTTTTYHVEYINGSWRWGTHWENGCQTCICYENADRWARNNGLDSAQNLVDLAQYINTCCAAAIPNPYNCDSTTMQLSDMICCDVKYWCCGGQLLRLKFKLYACGHEDDPEFIILEDAFSLDYIGSMNDAEQMKSVENYIIYGNPNDPCNITNETRQALLRTYLQYLLDHIMEPCSTNLNN